MPTRKLTPEEKKQMEKEYQKVFAKKEAEAQKALGLVIRAMRTRLGNAHHLWEGLRKDRNNSQFSFLLIETFGGATFPRIYLYNDAKKDIDKADKAIQAKEWKKIPRLLKSAELRVNRFDEAVNVYWNDISSGSKRAIFWTKFARGAGMAATTVLCVTFAGGPIGVALFAEGTLGSAATAGAVGGVLSKQIGTITLNASKMGHGMKVNFKWDKRIRESLEDALIGAVCGSASKVLNDKTLQATAKELNKLAKSRGTVAMCKLAIFNTWDEFMSKKARKYTTGATKKMTGKETMDQVMNLIAMEATKDPAFVKRYAQNLEALEAKAR